MFRPLFAAALLASIAPAARAACEGLTREEYKIWHDYKDALEDERVKKMKEKQKKPAIAKNFGISVKVLDAAIKKGDAAGAALPKQCEETSRAALTGTPVAERLLSLSVDSTSSHVVTYVSWRARKPADLEEEAALLAMKLAKASPITSTVALWAEDDQGKKVFEAKIASDAALNFKEERIAEFADSRYMKLFEDVKNSYASSGTE